MTKNKWKMLSVICIVAVCTVMFSVTLNASREIRAVKQDTDKIVVTQNHEIEILKEHEIYYKVPQSYTSTSKYNKMMEQLLNMEPEKLAKRAVDGRGTSLEILYYKGVLGKPITEYLNVYINLLDEEPFSRVYYHVDLVFDNKKLKEKGFAETVITKDYQGSENSNLSAFPVYENNKEVIYQDAIDAGIDLKNPNAMFSEEENYKTFEVLRDPVTCEIIEFRELTTEEMDAIEICRWSLFF